MPPEVAVKKVLVSLEARALLAFTALRSSVERVTKRTVKLLVATAD